MAPCRYTDGVRVAVGGSTGCIARQKHGKSANLPELGECMDNDSSGDVGGQRRSRVGESPVCLAGGAHPKYDRVGVYHRERAVCE